MRVFCDPSVLILLFYGDHPHHEAGIQSVRRFQAGQGFCASHSLVEAYSSLTRMPGKFRASPERARSFVVDLRDRLQPVALTAEEYAAALGRYSAERITGGAIYDAMIAHCAVKAGVDVLLTWNVRHFMRFGPDITRLVKTPVDLEPTHSQL